MKLIVCSAIGCSILFSSCSVLDPEYAQWKEQQKAANANPSPYGPGPTDPFGAPRGDGHFQELPHDPINPGPAPISEIPRNPYPGATPPPVAGRAVPHVVVKGDTIWGLSRRYGTTQEAIRAANGLTDDNIQLGRTLQIPSNN